MTGSGRSGYSRAIGCALLALIAPVCLGQAGAPGGCLPSPSLGVLWEETFLQTRDLTGAGWTVIGPSAWDVVREYLDAGNGDLFSGTTIIVPPPAATGEEGDYLVTTFVWNTQREGRFFVAVRFQDAANHYACEYQAGRDLLAVALVKVRDGVRTVLDRVDNVGGAVRIPDLTYGAGKRNGSIISVGAFGSQLCASVGGVVELRAEDADLTGGGVAFGQAEFHPFFDDVRVYVPAARAPRLGVPGVEFHVQVLDRDEGNAVVVDLMETGLEPCTLELRGEELWVRLGPLASTDAAARARNLLDASGYLYEETGEGSAGGNP